MLNKIASKVISSIFYEYIEQIDGSQLEVALWSGLVHLENVNIKTDALINQSIPFTVKKGIIGTIDLKLPWTKLSSEACEITIKNIYVLATFAENPILTDDFQQNTPKTTDETSNDSTNDQSNVSQKGVLTGLLGKIVDNLKFHVENVHIRVEIPYGGKYFALGVILLSIDWLSVDEKGNPIFVDADTPILRKNAQIKRFALYIDTNATPVSVDQAGFLKDMLDEITSSNHEFFLNPITFEAKIKISKDAELPNSKSDAALAEAANNAGPTGLHTKVKIRIDNLNLLLCRQQWKSILELQRLFMMFNRRRMYAMCGRPDHFPRSDRSSSYWWRYTHRCALEKLKKEQIDPSCVLQILKNRKEYMNLYSENRRQNRRSSIELTNLEETLDSNAITMLRLISKNEYESNLSLAAAGSSDSDEFFEIVADDTFSGPFGVFLIINSFNLKLSEDSGKSITRLVSNTLRMEYKKSGYSSFSAFSFANFHLMNDLNPNFPYLLSAESDNKDDSKSGDQLLVCYESQPNKPANILLSSPPLAFVFDYGYITSIVDFLSREKAEIEANAANNNSSSNDTQVLTATVVQIQQAIDTHVSYNINIAIKSFRFNFLYDVIEGNNYLAFVFKDISIKMIPNKYFDAEDYSSLYERFDIDFGNAALVINDKQFSSDFSGSLGLEIAIANSDLFPYFKFDANVDSDLTVNLDQFTLNFLIQLYFYIADILYPFQAPADVFKAENDFHLNFSHVLLNVSYRDEHLYLFNITPLIIDIILKEHKTIVSVKTSKILSYEYFNKTENLFLEATPSGENSLINGYVGCTFVQTFEDKTVKLDFGDAVVHDTLKPLNFLINYFRFTDYETKMGLIDKPDPMNFTFVSKYEYVPTKLYFSMRVHALTWFMNNDLAKLTADSFTYSLNSFDQDMDMYIYVTHPVVVTDQLHDFHTILDTNPDPKVPFKMEFHKFLMSAELSDTKFTLHYLYFTHLCRYLFGLFTYGKTEETAPGSMLYSAINVDVKNLELTVGYKSEINDYLVMKTPHLFMQTPEIPTKFHIVFDTLDVFHHDKEVMKTPEITIDMLFDLIKYKEGDLYSKLSHEKEDIKKMISETKDFLQTKQEDAVLYATGLWLVGITMDFNINDITVNYNHNFCHTFKKCIYSFWDYDGPADAFATEFHCLFTLGHAHVPIDRSGKFADIIFENFKFRYTDQQEFEFGDVSVVPLLENDVNYYGGNIITNMEKKRREEKKLNEEKNPKRKSKMNDKIEEEEDEKEIPPIMTFALTPDNLYMTFNNMNILIHPTFFIPLFYYILGCPFFGEEDDPKPEKSKEFVFSSSSMYLTILTKPGFYNFTLSFGFQFDWSDTDFIINFINLAVKADNRTTNVIEPFNLEYKKIRNDEDFYTQAEQIPKENNNNNNNSTDTNKDNNNTDTNNDNNNTDTNVDNENKKKIIIIKKKPKTFLYSKQALMSEMNMTVSVTDLILFNSQLNLLLASFANESVPIKKSDVISTDNGADKIDIKVMTIDIVLCHSQPGASAKFPFLKLFINSFDISSESEDDLYLVKSSIVPYISMMNFTSGTWDLLVEPFQIDFLAKYTDMYKEFTISTLQEINVNISSNFVRQIIQFGSDLSFEQDAQVNGEKSSISFISIENRTGSDVVIFRENDKVVPLSAGSLIQLYDLPPKQILSVSFGNSIEQLCNFKPESIVYPTFIHQRCVVNSFPYKGTRLITLSSPFAVENKTGINLEIYTVYKKKTSFLGLVEAYKTFPIPYTVFISDGFIFKEPSMSIELNHDVFKHKRWTTKINKSIDILTPDGELSCVIREDIDPSQNIGMIHIIPSVTFYNEMPVDLTVQLSRSQVEIKMKPGEVVDVPNIGSAELNFRCRVKIDGYEYSKAKLVSLQFDNTKSGKFFITKTDDETASIGISTMTHHTVDQSQSSIIFYSPCIIFNLFGHDLIVTPHDEDRIYHFDNFGTDYLMIPFASLSFFKSRNLYAHIMCPPLSRWSRQYIDCTATGLSDVIFLPRENQPSLYIPVNYRVTQAEPPCFHSRIVTLVPSLSIYNELDANIILEPEPVECTSVNEDNDADNPNLIDDTDEEMMLPGLATTETFRPHAKTHVLCTNKNFSYNFTMNGYSVCNGLILSSPVKTVFRLFNEDGDSCILIECEVVEDGFGLCAHFRKPSFPSPFIVCNYLSDIELSGYQILRRNAFKFKPMTSTLFALDSPFGQQGMILEYKDRSILISLSEETIPLPLNGTPFTIEIRTVTNGNILVIISRDPVIITRNLFNLYVNMSGLSISLIDSLYRELCLISFGNMDFTMSTTQTDYSIELTLDSFQVDDQCLTTAFPVILNGSSTKRNKFLKVSASFYRGAPFLISFNMFSFTLQKIIIYGDLAFISDFFTMVMDTFYAKTDGTRKISDIHPPSQNPESDSVGKILSFKKFRLSPILLEVNYRSVTGRPTTLPIDPDMPITIFKLVGNITGANIRLNGIIFKNFRAPLSFLQRNLMANYKNSLMSQMWALTGHSDILFNTFGIAESFTSGVSSYYQDPDKAEQSSDEIPQNQGENENNNDNNNNDNSNDNDKKDKKEDENEKDKKDEKGEKDNTNDNDKKEEKDEKEDEDEKDEKEDKLNPLHVHIKPLPPIHIKPPPPIHVNIPPPIHIDLKHHDEDHKSDNEETNKVEDTKKDETNKVEDTKKDETNKEENAKKDETNKVEDTKKDETNKVEDTKKDETNKVEDTKKDETNKVEDTKKDETNKVEDTKKDETNKVEDTKKDETNKVEDTKKDEANKVEDTKKDETNKVEDTKKDETNKVEDTKKDETNKVEDTKKDETNKVEDTKKDEANKVEDTKKDEDTSKADDSKNEADSDGTKRGPLPPTPPIESAFIEGIPHDLERADSFDERVLSNSNNDDGEQANSSMRARQAFGSILQSGEGFLRGVSSLFSINSFGHRSINTGGLNQTSGDTVKDGFVSLGTGIVDGLVGVVMDPVEGGKRDGVKGAFVGIGKGLAGIIMRPIAGILDAGAGIIGGVRSAVKNDKDLILKRHRIPRTYMLTKVDKYDPVRAQIMLLIQERLWSVKNPNETMCAFVDDPNVDYIFCLCTSSFYIVIKTEKGYEIKKTVSIEKVVDTTFQKRKVVVSVKNFTKKGQKEDYIFCCRDEFTAEEIATLIHSHKIEEDVFK